MFITQIGFYPLMISQTFAKLNSLFQFFIELNKQNQEKPRWHTKQRKRIKRTQRTTKKIDEKKARKQGTQLILCVNNVKENE